MKHLIVFACTAVAAFAQQASPKAEKLDENTTPGTLLSESLLLAKQRADHGVARTVALLRLRATMRMAGMMNAAVAAFDECAALAASSKTARMSSTPSQADAWAWFAKWLT